MKNLRFWCSKAPFTRQKKTKTKWKIKIRFQICLGTCGQGFYTIKWTERSKQSKPNSQPSAVVDTDLQISVGPGHPDPEIRGGGGPGLKKNFFDPSCPILI